MYNKLTINFTISYDMVILHTYYEFLYHDIKFDPSKRSSKLLIVYDHFELATTLKLL